MTEEQKKKKWLIPLCAFVGGLMIFQNSPFVSIGMILLGFIIGYFMWLSEYKEEKKQTFERDFEKNIDMKAKYLSMNIHEQELEKLKLENEEKRALVESLRKQQGLGGSDKIYKRVD